MGRIEEGALFISPFRQFGQFTQFRPTLPDNGIGRAHTVYGTHIKIWYARKLNDVQSIKKKNSLKLFNHTLENQNCLHFLKSLRRLKISKLLYIWKSKNGWFYWCGQEWGTRYWKLNISSAAAVTQNVWNWIEFNSLSD